MSGNANSGRKNQWIKGVSGNPAGTTKDHAAQVRSLQAYIRKITNDGQEIIDKVTEIMRHAPNAQTQLVAAQLLLDRAYGKAREEQHVTLNANVSTSTEHSISLKGLDPAALLQIRNQLSRQIDQGDETPLPVIDTVATEPAPK